MKAGQGARKGSSPKISTAERLYREQETARRRVERREAAQAARQAEEARKAKRRAQAAARRARAKLAKDAETAAATARAAAHKARRTGSRSAAWDAALERMREHTAAVAGGATLAVEEVRPSAAHPVQSERARRRGQRWDTPWHSIATITPADALAYEAMAEIFRMCEEDRQIYRWMSGGRTYSRIALDYDGPERRGSTTFVQRVWTVAEIGPWDVVISRAREQCDTEEDDTPGARYAESTAINSWTVWLSTRQAEEVPF